MTNITLDMAEKQKLMCTECGEKFEFDTVLTEMYLSKLDNGIACCLDLQSQLLVL